MHVASLHATQRRTLLDFGGADTYFKGEPALAGRTFRDTLGLFPTSSIIGLRQADGAIRTNPPMDTVVSAGDAVIAISADDDTVVAEATPGEIVADAIVANPAPRRAAPESTLILGWNTNAPLILRELDQYVDAGSRVHVVAEFLDGLAATQALCPSTAKLQVDMAHGDTTDRRTLDGLDVPSFDHVILLSPQIDDGHEDEHRADARTLVTLLHLRDIGEKSGRRFSIVSEMLDIRNRALAEVTRADDFIVGDQLASLLLTQISENKELNAVFSDLFDPEGSEIYLKPASDYVLPGREVTFSTVVESARRRGEIAIGYRLHRHATDKAQAYGVATNPAKATRVSLGAADCVIVLAEG